MFRKCDIGQSCIAAIKPVDLLVIALILAVCFLLLCDREVHGRMLPVNGVTPVRFPNTPPLEARRRGG